MEQYIKYQSFKKMHESQDVLIMPNAYNGGSAKLLSEVGFTCLGTTSAGLAYGIGCNDQMAMISRDVGLANAKEIVDAVQIPVSADLENGYGSTLDDVQKTLEWSIKIGLAGGAIEDVNPDSRQLYDFLHAVERVEAACEIKKRYLFC